MEKNLWNILVVSFGFFLNFTAFGGLQNLQSSLYSEEGLGVATLSTIYCSMMLSSMFLSPLLIKKFGCKWTMVGSMSCYLTFSLANFYANWYTLIPTSTLLGLGAAPLWASQCTYITIVGNLQAKKEGKFGKDVVNQYFGVFFLIFQSSGVWGNLISSLVFSQTPTHGSSILAILLLIVFLESVEERMENEGEAGSRSPPLRSALLATFMLFKNDKRLCFLILLPLYSGMNQGFIYGEYTKSFATCALGIHFVGYVMICFSGASSLCSLLYGKISKYTGRAALFVLGAVIHFSCFIALLLWHPNPAHLPVFFILPGLWGMADAVWQTQNNALYGVLFEKNKEAAFANYRLGESLGYVIAFGYSSFLCVSTKLCILLGVLIVTMMAYGIVEYLEPKTTNKSVATEDKSQAEKEEMKTEV
ncbi:protein unc-93 homolog A isoform X2 [Peromyscus californicus insignis]|uniref:protein unc-93 homolog A isoform X2 n=1 Tax=Peromyscus californicus insignis TaxID=564181 RepID=UPI0022A7EEB4|nr:protein unc-93 homolog A isoform X2 [Peromyscus californicus insignis]